MADIQDLLQLQFSEIGSWALKDNGKIDYLISSGIDAKSISSTSNVLYSFVLIDENGQSFVKYLGKTTKGILTRLSQYKSGSGQATNKRINKSINLLLKENKTVKIFVLVDIPALQWGGYNLNLPAGLEDSLITSFKPEWNNTHGVAKTTLAELEDEIIFPDIVESAKDDNNKSLGSCIKPCGKFLWKLGDTYYNYGFMNPGVKVDTCFGQADEIVTLIFPDGIKFKAAINRTANANHTVRLHFIQAVSYIQKNYLQNQILEIKICENNQLFVIN